MAIRFQDKNWNAVRQGFDMWVSSPSGLEPKTLTKEDVWGKFREDPPGVPRERLTKGMIVASQMQGYPHICPIWGDELPSKSVTAICKKSQEDDVKYWLEYVHGGDSVSRRKDLPGGKVALRSDYKCW